MGINLNSKRALHFRPKYCIACVGQRRGQTGTSDGMTALCHQAIQAWIKTNAKSGVAQARQPLHDSAVQVGVLPTRSLAMMVPMPGRGVFFNTPVSMSTCTALSMFPNRLSAVGLEEATRHRVIRQCCMVLFPPTQPVHYGKKHPTLPH